MQITNTIITKQATAESSIAKYQFEYTISEGRLTRVFASIFALQPDENQSIAYIGNISCENGMVNCSLPQNAEVVSHLEDFQDSMTRIQADVKASLE